MSASLKAKIRDIEGDKANKIRAAGQLPAVLYGHGIKNVHLVLEYRDFSKTFEQAGESQLVQLEIDKEKAPRNVLIHDIDKDVLSNKFTHVDFYQVKMDEKITAEVPLIFEGESEAVKTLGGILIKNIHSLKIKSLPANLPTELKIDIGQIKTFENKIHIKDLKLASGVEILGQPEEIIASVTPPRSEEELADLESKVEEDISEVKVVEKEPKAKETEEPESEEKELSNK